MPAVKNLVAQLKKTDIELIYIAARGTSDHAAVYAKYVFECLLGIPVVLAAPSVITVYQKELNLKKAFVLGISQSGKAQDVLEVIKAGKKQNALTASITNDINSPLAKEAHHHLYTNAGVELSVAATKTFTSQMMIIAMLSAEWKEDMDLCQVLNEIPVNMDNTIKSKESMVQKVERLLISARV